MSRPRAILLAVLAALLSSLVVAPPSGAAAPLTNLDHLDWLSVEVAPPDQAGHTSYRLDAEPDVGVLWTYAEPAEGGGFRPVGGGSYDPATDTWGQGAFNADDVARAAVVYLRHWRATGAASSRRQAYQLLRGLTYLQTASGPDAGNVVLWMQPDGTLNPSAEPREEPDPSDSDASYWLARTLWALGEGYAAFRRADPAFAGFLRERMELAIAAVDRQVLDRYGEHLDIDGRPAPAWLIVDGADASSEAVLGLSAYVDAGGGRAARSALRKLSEGIAELGSTRPRRWPFGALRPWALSRSVWHAWGAQMPTALTRAGATLGDRSLTAAAARDSFTFTPWLLTSGGPDNGRLPTRGDASQIAYGADARVQGQLAQLDAAGRRSTSRRSAARLAAVTAGWFFGANPAGEPMYDPATGVTYDGISSTGSINRNSGAESTIHGLLTMLALDAHPAVASAARATTSIARRVGTVTVSAEDGTPAGDAQELEPADRWTGESLVEGRGLVLLGDGGSVALTVRTGEASWVWPVVDFRPGSTATTRFDSDGRVLGRVASGDIGPQGDSPALGALLPATLGRSISGGAHVVTARTRATGGDVARLDALMVEPLVSRVVYTGGGGATALLTSRATTRQRRTVALPGTGVARVESYDRLGRLVSATTTRARVVSVSVVPGGFTLVLR